MNVCIFDTETTSLEKPFCYNIGYVVADTETRAILVKREFVVGQIWHNSELFTTAYYANKRPIYVNAMRARKVFMNKFGYICQQMLRDFRALNVERAFAYNSSFDEKVFNFNCDWFKCINPFDVVPISDIRGFVHHFMMNDEFKRWAEEHNAFTESGNYSTTAETITQYIRNDSDFVEDHTALSDTLIETEILFHCLDLGADINGDYIALKSIPRAVEKVFTIVAKNGKKYTFKGESAVYYKTKGVFKIR